MKHNITLPTANQLEQDRSAYAKAISHEDWTTIGKLISRTPYLKEMYEKLFQNVFMDIEWIDGPIDPKISSELVQPYYQKQEISEIVVSKPVAPKVITPNNSRLPCAVYFPFSARDYKCHYCALTRRASKDDVFMSAKVDGRDGIAWCIDCATDQDKMFHGFIKYVRRIKRG